jgi:hypothetical protein
LATKRVGIGGGSANNPVKPPSPTRAGRGRGGVTGGAQPKKFTTEQAKAALVEYISAGYNIGAACDKIGYARKTYESWRAKDPDFKAKVDSVMATRKVDTGTREEKRKAAREMGFAAWSEKYLKTKVFPHAQQWIDVLEGREPSELHPAQTWEPAKRLTRLVVNTFPNAGKSTTLTMNYVTYRICINPGIKIAIISKTEGMAKDMVHGVKTRLTHPDHQELIKDFAPEGGFEATADEWSSGRVRLAAADRDPADKDPTIQALGLGSQVYGKRLDLVLVDDAIDSENAQQWRPQMKWLNLEVASRPGMAGRIVVIGTRIAPGDLYYQLRQGENFQSGKSPWSYLSQPVLLEDDPDPEKWVTLWPRATTSWWTEDEDCPCEQDVCKNGYGDGTYPRLDPVHLQIVRESADADTWNTAYMQLEVGTDAAFPPHAIQAATNKARRHGKDGGMQAVPEGKYVIGSLDPATSGAAAFVVGAVDRQAGRRWLYDAWNVKHPTPKELKDRVKAITIEFGVREWRIEKTGLLTMFTQDHELNTWLNARGVRLVPHYTGKNKHDTSFGVGSMAPLFGVYQQGEDGEQHMIVEPLIELPRHEGDIATLVNQLQIWHPDIDPKKTAIDLVMALWFFDIGCRDHVRTSDQQTRRRQFSRMTSPRDRQRARVYDLSQYQRAG